MKSQKPPGRGDILMKNLLLERKLRAKKVVGRERNDGQSESFHQTTNPVVVRKVKAKKVILEQNVRESEFFHRMRTARKVTCRIRIKWRRRRITMR